MASECILFAFNRAVSKRWPAQLGISCEKHPPAPSVAETITTASISWTTLPKKKQLASALIGRHDLTSAQCCQISFEIQMLQTRDILVALLVLMLRICDCFIAEIISYIPKMNQVI